MPESDYICIYSCAIFFSMTHIEYPPQKKDEKRKKKRILCVYHNPGEWDFILFTFIANNEWGWKKIAS